MTEIIAAFVGALCTLLVWYLGQRSLSKAERDHKKREIRLDFLIDAYRKLESAGNRALAPHSDVARSIESAIADIQLFGSKRQAELAYEMARQFADTKSASFDDILNELRRDLREELQLEELPLKRAILRITEK